MAKPPGWFFVSLADHWAMSAEYRRSLDAEARQALEHPEAIPILVISKYKRDSPESGVAPSITVYDESTHAIGERSALELLQGSMSALKPFASDMSLTEEPTSLMVPGANSAAASLWSYSEPVEGEYVRVRTRTILTVIQGHALTFHFFMQEGAPRSVAQELRNAERTITFAEA